MALTNQEKQELARKISRGVQVISSSIAQLHLGSPDPSAPAYGDDSGIIQSLRQYGEGRWKFTQIEGALLLTKDPNGVCHFRIYDLGEYKLRFQYELYENMEYQKLHPQIHAFEMESCVCGFCFSRQDVAEKFFGRVQNNITRGRAPAANMMQSRKAPPPVPAKGRRNNKNTKKNNKLTESSKMRSFNGSKDRSVRKLPQPQQQRQQNNQMFLQNGTIDPNNVPKEWKRILKKAGIRKKDLRNPQMFEVIRSALAQQGIDLTPPDQIDYDDEELKKLYPPEQLAAWKKYQADMKKYEEDKARYERELREYEMQMEQEKKLHSLMQTQNMQFGNTNGMTGAQKLRASVMQYQGRDVQNAVPHHQQRQMPRMSVAKPVIPRVAAVAPRKKHPAQQIMNQRASKVMIKAGFLADIKKNETKLKHVSVLPELTKLGKETEGGLLAAIKKKMAENRVQLTGGDESDDDNFSTFSDN